MAISIPYSTGNSSASVTTLIKLALWLIPLALACLLALTLYNDFSALSSQAQTKASNTPKAAKPRTSMGAPQLASLHLFGQLGAASTENTGNRPLPQTRLQLVLKGAFTNTDASQASALIAASKGKTSKRYKVNETLPGGAKLHSVATDSVTLDRGGNLEVLRFPKAKSSGTMRVSARSSSSSRSSARNVPSRSKPAVTRYNASRQNSRMR